MTRQKSITHILCATGDFYVRRVTRPTRNAAYGQPYRGFESLPLRQTALNSLVFTELLWLRPRIGPRTDRDGKISFRRHLVADVNRSVSTTLR